MLVTPRWTNSDKVISPYSGKDQAIYYVDVY